jgi:hypothetical protein
VRKDLSTKRRRVQQPTAAAAPEAPPALTEISQAAAPGQPWRPLDMLQAAGGTDTQAEDVTSEQQTGGDRLSAQPATRKTWNPGDCRDMAYTMPQMEIQ